MTDTEKISKMQEELHQIGNQMRDMKTKMDQIVVALMGSDLTKDGGIIARINWLEGQQEKLQVQLDAEVAALKAASSKQQIYQNILWAMAGAICTGIFAFVMKNILTK